MAIDIGEALHRLNGSTAFALMQLNVKERYREREGIMRLWFHVSGLLAPLTVATPCT